jgi:hypothetical protein
VEARRGLGQDVNSGSEVVEEPARVVQHGARDRERSDPLFLRRRRLFQQLLGLRADARERSCRHVRVRDRVRDLRRHRPELLRRAPRAPDQPVEPSAAVREVAGHVLEPLEQRRGVGHERVHRRTASREPGPEVAERVLEGAPGRRVEGVLHLVELDVRLRRRHGQSAVLRDLLPAGARHELEVLQPERRARADGDLAVVAQLQALVEAHVEDRERPARAGLRGDRLHDPHALAADPDLVVLGQPRGVRHERLDLVGGHERQPLVGVVGEEDGHEGHEHGDRPDQDRARDEAGCPGSRPHLPSR